MPMRPPGPGRFPMQPQPAMSMTEPVMAPSAGLHGNQPSGMGYQQMMQPMAPSYQMPGGVRVSGREERPASRRSEGEWEGRETS